MTQCSKQFLAKTLLGSFCVLMVLSQDTYASEWQGSVSLKNNYVFSTGTEIDDGPVIQAWVRNTSESGFYTDLWSNIALTSGNPNRSNEIDFSVGKHYALPNGDTLTASVSYFDIQTPDLLDLKDDVWGPVLRYETSSFYSELMMFFVEGGDDGYRIANVLNHPLIEGWTLTAAVNYADGPYKNEAAVIGKLGVFNWRRDRFINSVGLEFSELLYAQDDNDARGFAATISLSKDLF